MAALAAVLVLLASVATLLVVGSSTSADIEPAEHDFPVGGDGEGCEEVKRTKQLLGGYNYLEGDPHIQVYHPRQAATMDAAVLTAPVDAQGGNLRGRFCVLPLSPTVLPDNACMEAIAKDPGCKYGARPKGQKNWWYSRWTSRINIERIHPLLKSCMDALEAMALGLFKAKPIYQAWWTMTLRKYGQGGPSLHTDTKYPYRGDRAFHLRISSVKEDTPIDFVYFPRGGIPPNMDHVQTVHRVMIPSGNVWIGDPVATGALPDKNGGVWAHAVPYMWAGQAAAPAWYLTLVLDTQSDEPPKPTEPTGPTDQA